MEKIDRRRFVLGSGAVVISGFAGCIGDDDDPDDDNGEPADGDEPANGADVPDEVDEHLEEANGYDGTMEDLTGEDEVTIDVGDPEGGTNYMFDPPAAQIDEGTTVVWEWVDDDGHSVTHVDDEFDSDIETDYTFEHTFEEAGNYLYVCVPHEALGHLGAIVVE